MLIVTRAHKASSLTVWSQMYPSLTSPISAHLHLGLCQAWDSEALKLNQTQPCLGELPVYGPDSHKTVTTQGTQTIEIYCVFAYVPSTSKPGLALMRNHHHSINPPLARRQAEALELAQGLWLVRHTQELPSLTWDQAGLQRKAVLQPGR